MDQIFFRKNVRKWPFGSKKKIVYFFWNCRFWTSDGRQNIKKKNFEPEGSFRTFFRNSFLRFYWPNGYQTTPFGPLMTPLFLKIAVSAGYFWTFSNFFLRKLSSNMGIKQLRLKFLRTRIPSKKCPKVTFWLEKSFTRTVSMDPIKCNGDFDNFLVENPPFFNLYFKRSASFAIIFMSKLWS